MRNFKAIAGVDAIVSALLEQKFSILLQTQDILGAIYPYAYDLQLQAMFYLLFMQKFWIQMWTGPHNRIKQLTSLLIDM